MIVYFGNDGGIILMNRQIKYEYIKYDLYCHKHKITTKILAKNEECKCCSKCLEENMYLMLRNKSKLFRNIGDK